MFKDFRIWEDDLVPIYRAVGTEPFTYPQIAHIITSQDVRRYSARKYFLPVMNKGHRCRDEKNRPLWRLNGETVRRCVKRLASPDADHRWENLAEGLTGGEHA